MAVQPQQEGAGIVVAIHVADIGEKPPRQHAITVVQSLVEIAFDLAARVEAFVLAPEHVRLPRRRQQLIEQVEPALFDQQAAPAAMAGRGHVLGIGRRQGVDADHRRHGHDPAQAGLAIDPDSSLDELFRLGVVAVQQRTGQRGVGVDIAQQIGIGAQRHQRLGHRLVVAPHRPSHGRDAQCVGLVERLGRRLQRFQRLGPAGSRCLRERRHRPCIGPGRLAAIDMADVAPRKARLLDHGGVVTGEIALRRLCMLPVERADDVGMAGPLADQVARPDGAVDARHVPAIGFGHRVAAILAAAQPEVALVGGGAGLGGGVTRVQPPDFVFHDGGIARPIKALDEHPCGKGGQQNQP